MLTNGLPKLNVRILAVVVALVAPAMALGQPRVPPSQADEIVRSLPSGCEAAVVVTGASTQRRSAAGRALQAMLAESGAFPETKRAWLDLAAALDWPAERAFDELLGQRVALVVQDLRAPQPKWALLMVVSAEAERRLRDRLGGAPRGAVAGMPVLSVEGGRYELMIGRPPPGVDPGMVAGAASSSVVLLAPGGENALFADLAPMLVSRSGLAGPAPTWGAGKKECDLVVVVRDSRQDDTARFMCLTAMQNGKGWDARVVCTANMIWDHPGEIPAIRPWSDGSFAALEPGALVAVMGLQGTIPDRAAEFVPGLMDLVPALLGSRQPAAGELTAVIIRPNSASGSTGVRRSPGTVRADSGIRFAAGNYTLVSPVSPADTGPASRAAGPLSVTVAAQVADGRGSAAAGDYAVAGFIGTLESGQRRIPADAPVVFHDGLISDQTIRALSLDGEFPIHDAYARTLERAFGSQPLLTWGATRPAPILARGSSGPEREAGPGWWVARLSPESSTSIARDAAVLSGPQSGNTRPRLTTGVVRPGSIFQLLGETGPGFLGSFMTASRVESFRWDLWLRADGAVEGTAAIELRR